MKKCFYPFAIFMLFLSLTACGETTEEKLDGAVEKTETEQPAEETQADEASENENDMNQVIVDNDNVKVTLVKIVKKEDSIWGRSVEVVFDVQNKRQESIEA